MIGWPFGQKKVNGVFPYKLIHDIEILLKPYTDRTYYGLDVRRLREDLVKNGFKDLPREPSAAYNRLLLKKGEFVFKDCGVQNYIVPESAIPTYIFSKTRSFNEIGEPVGWFILAIQPFADVKSKEFKNKLSKVNWREFHGDAHSKNLGLYKDKLVSLDW